MHEPAHATYLDAVARAHDAYAAAIELVRDEVMGLQQRFTEQAEPLLEAMRTELEESPPDNFDWPEPAEVDEDDDDPLYDSMRGYVEQVDRFRRYQGKDSDVRFARDRLFTKTCTECNKPFSTGTARQTVCRSPACLSKRACRLRLERERCTKKTQKGQS